MKRFNNFNLKVSDLEQKKEDSLNFYTINSWYYHKLREADPENVMFLKKRRPFVGIVLIFNKRTYYAPCTSPKERYTNNIKNKSFLLIDDGKYGAIRFDSMVPVPAKYAIPFNSNKISFYDDSKKFDSMQKIQIQWIRKNKNCILEAANDYFVSYRKNILTDEEKKHSVNLKKVNKVFDNETKIHQKKPQNDYVKESKDFELYR